MTIDVTKPLAHDDGFARMPNILFRMYPILDGFTLETVGLYGYLLSWRQNKSGHAMYGKVWLNQSDITAQTGLSAYKIRAHISVLEKYGLLKATKSRKVANKRIYEPLEPLTEAEFRAIYAEEMSAFQDRMDAADREIEEARDRLQLKQAEFEPEPKAS
ncbi:helix-turn-helix transcriptional regulator [Paenibacillus sp. JNUCC31]|uniref:helix-turn-helix domain-containing protein n=1 Tax=Paenibacillus sp. JNUCC-31 TaxID=2777983 RepID=UPI001781C379|nr:helix-turn-helix domain-containing protein [Paenibacillus sp. JNUCC-31]QOS80996.1 helix-turn-helix transcriptional regulator [Paenibacillus sp. JNUCC-31]